MTIADLIAKLQALLDHSLRVVTPGFDEAGYDDMERLDVVRIVLNAAPGGHGPQHEEFDADEHDASHATDALSINW